MSKHIGKRIAAAAAIILGLGAAASAGPFTNPSILAADPSIAAWADGVASVAPTPSGSGAASNALGAANGTLASLGDLTAAQITGGVDPGEITLTFSTPIMNGTGADLAIFENAFASAGFWFAELGYVEVSSDGVNFARFPSVSLNTEADLNVGFGRNFALIDRTNTHNLAGIHGPGEGTLFDLDDLLADALVTGGLVDLGAIGFVRIVDVPGNGAFLDSLGNPILDAWVTVGAGGVDLDAIAALHVVPEPGTLLLVGLGLAALAPRRRLRPARRFDGRGRSSRRTLSPASFVLERETHDEELPMRDSAPDAAFAVQSEVHRLEVVDGAIVRIRCYCFCRDTVRLVASHLGIASLVRPYRSPSPA